MVHELEPNPHEDCDYCCDVCGQWVNECTCDPPCLEAKKQLEVDG